jgi:hypothetical protein
MADIEDESGTGIEDESETPITGEAGYEVGTPAGTITPTGIHERDLNVNRSAAGDL